MDIQALDPILLLLLKYPKGVSQSFLVQQLGISYSSILQHIESLRNQGYTIQYSDENFSLIYPLPFALIPEKIKLNIFQSDVSKILFVDRCTSTNILARHLISKFSSFFLIARDQYQGKGRMNRTWDMQKDKDLALSFGYRMENSRSYFSLIRAASLAVAKTLNEFGISCFVKWPNDIVTREGKKICGILAEVIDENSITTIVIGIGININSKDLPDYAISVYQILGCEVDINKLAAQLIIAMNSFYSEFPQNKSLIAEQWYEKLAWLGEKVIFQIGDRQLVGFFRGCTENGSLQLEIGNRIQTFCVGDLHNIKFRKY